jgi:hypothetical protein
VKNFFLTRAMREKALLLLFVGLAAFIWLSSVGKRGRVFVADWSGNAIELSSQAKILRDRAAIEKQADAAIKNLDPAKTLDATRLNGELDAIARQVSLSPSIESPVTTRIDQFSVHTTQITFQKANLAALLRFDEELARRSPYLGLEGFNLRVDPAGLLSVSFKVSSTEIRR